MYHLAHKLEQQKDSQGNLDRTDFYLNVGNLCEPRNGMRERGGERETCGYWWVWSPNYMGRGGSSKLNR